MSSQKVDNAILLLLISVTVIVAVAQRYSLNNELIINGLSDVLIRTETDQKFNGLSTSSLTVHDDKLILSCNIKKSAYAWPFCNIAFVLHQDKGGSETGALDLSGFDTVHVSVQYLSETNAGLRFQLRNFNQKYSTISNPETWKFIGVEYWTDLSTATTTFPMNSMQVPTWWQVNNKISIANSAPEFEQIMLMEIATGNNIPEGTVLIEVEQIKFTGKYFSTERVYGFLLALWFVTALASLLLKLVKTKEILLTEIRKKERLVKSYRRLNLQTKGLKYKSNRDQLTGALNRHGAEELFSQQLDSFSLIILDVDHFKLVNDENGHGVGDKILAELAKLIHRHSRSTDFLIRWGGEEFLLLCLGSDIEQAFIFAENLRERIKKYQWPNDIDLSCSFGVSAKENETISECIERADQALLSAKSNGRNQTARAQ